MKVYIPAMISICYYLTVRMMRAASRFSPRHSWRDVDDWVFALTPMLAIIAAFALGLWTAHL